MDLAHLFVLVSDAGWLFLTAWGIVLTGLSVIAFGRDILPPLPPSVPQKERT
jgi:hypothetical protein